MRTDKEIEPTIVQASMGSISANGADGIGQPLQESTKKELIAALQQNWLREVKREEESHGRIFFAHFAVGAAKTLVNGRSWFHSGMEMTIVGAIEAVITYVSGAALRVAA